MPRRHVTRRRSLRGGAQLLGGFGLAFLVPFYAFAGCSVSTGALSFGTINPLKATDTLTSAAIVVSCDVSPPPTVTLSVGPGTSGSRRPRYLVRGAGGERIAYELYLDPGMQRPLGDGLEGTSTVSERVFKDKPWVISVYGLVPARQNVSVGPYFDTIQVRVDF